MPSQVWIDGKLVDKNDAKISVFDHGLLFGDGVWEGMRAYDGRVFKLREHLDRLYRSAELLSLTIPVTSDELGSAVTATLQANHRSHGYVRVLVTRGPGTLGLDPRKCEPQVIVIVDDIALYPKELYENGLEVITSSFTRNHPNAINPRIKSLNYLNNILAKIEAIRAGCLEAIMLNHKGEVA